MKSGFKAVLLLWIFYVFFVLCLLCLCARLFICALWSPAGKGLTSWLSFVVSNCEFVTFPSVSWVKCGIYLSIYLFIIPNPLPSIIGMFACFLSFFLSIFTGSLIYEHYTRECEFGNFDKIKNTKHKKNKTTQKNTKTFG